MVHALTEAHRVLQPEGWLLDLRPDRDPGGRRTRYLPVEVRVAGRAVPVGHLHERGDYHADYVASERAVERVIRQGLFGFAGREQFMLAAVFRSLAALEEALRREWTATHLPPQTRRRLIRELRRDPDSRIVVRDPFCLTVLRKREDRP